MTKKDNDEFDIDDLKRYRQLTAKQKLEYLEMMNLFLLKITPAKIAERSKKLKEEGY